MAKATIGKGVKTKTTWANALKRDWQLYLLLMIPVALVVIFNYMHHMAASVWYSWTTNLRKVMPAVNG